MASTIITQFPELLKVAERDGEGGLAAEPPAIIKGEALSLTSAMPAHPVYGDWTDGTFTAVLRAAPGAEPLAEYTCTTGTVAGLLTPVTLALPADALDDVTLNIGTGMAELFFSLIFTPAGGTPDTLITTRQLVRGG
jgi:hypothetical protein